MASTGQRPAALVLIAVVIVVVVVVVLRWCGPATTQVFLVRHADRAGTADALSAPGTARSQELVHVFQHAGLGAIVRSDTVRAEQTAAPLAAATGIAPVVLPANDPQAFVDEIRQRQRGHMVLVVGHSNTVPLIVAGLGGPSLPEIAAAEFDRLFALTLCRCAWGSPALAQLQYGASSP